MSNRYETQELHRKIHHSLRDLNRMYKDRTHNRIAAKSR